MIALTPGFPQHISETRPRIIAYAIDRLLIMMCWAPLLAPTFKDLILGAEVKIELVRALMTFIFVMSYQTLFLKLVGGTPGKLIMGLRVVSRNTGGALGWMQAFVRVAADFFAQFFDAAFRVLAFWRFDRTHLSDWLAETQVRQFKTRAHHPGRKGPWVALLFLYLLVAGFEARIDLIKKISVSGLNLQTELSSSLDGDFNKEL